VAQVEDEVGQGVDQGVLEGQEGYQEDQVGLGGLLQVLKGEEVEVEERADDHAQALVDSNLIRDGFQSYDDDYHDRGPHRYALVMTRASESQNSHLGHPVRVELLQRRCRWL